MEMRVNRKQPRKISELPVVFTQSSWARLWSCDVAQGSGLPRIRDW